MTEATDIRRSVADALARALLDRGVEALVIHEHALSILMPYVTEAWPVWVNAYVTRWRYGPGRDDWDQAPHDGAVDELAARILASIGGGP